MFQTEKEKKGLPEGEIIAFLGKGTEFKGVLTYEGSVRVDGTLEGEVITKGTLVVGETATVNAEMNVGTIVTAGKITGNIIAKNKVHLLAPGSLVGTIKTPVLIVEEGVFFDGKCEMSREEKPVIGERLREQKEMPGGKIVK